MKRLLTALFLLLALVSVAHAQSNPGWVSRTNNSACSASNASQTNPACRAILATDFDTAFSLKADLLNLATGGLLTRDLRDREADRINALDYAKCDGLTDDSMGLQRAINVALGAGKGLYIPGGRACVITVGLTATVGGQSVFSFASDGGLHGAKLRFPSGFAGTGLAVTMTGGSPATDDLGGFGLTMSDLTFVYGGSATGGSAVAVTTSGGGAAMPALEMSDLTFTSYTGGSWSSGLSLISDNVTSLSDIYCTNSFAGACVTYDTPGQISVEHHIKDLYINGRSGTGAVGLKIGHTGMTGPLQGFTIRGLSCTGGDYCVAANSATSAIDEIDVEGSQISATVAGIQDTGGDTLIATGNYFLCGGRAIDAENMNRLVATGNTFYLGPPSVGTTTNISIYTANLGGGPASGGIISGNLFTNLYGIPIQLGPGTVYLTVSGNTCLGNQCVNDTSGNTSNNVGPNLDSGNLAFATPPTFYAGLKVGARNTAYPMIFTADGVGNGKITTNLGTGAGTLELGPNLQLDGSTIAGPIKAQSGSFSALSSFYAGLQVGQAGSPYPLLFTADGVGNGKITTATALGNGILELGPNTQLDNTTTANILKVSGSFYMPSTTVNPATTPLANLGLSQGVVDTTDSKLCFYLPSGWKCTALQ